MIKRILLISICFILLPPLSKASEEISILYVDGFGASQSIAIQNALIEALKQSKGVTIDSKKIFEKKLREKSLSQENFSSHEVEINARHQSSVKEATKGLVQEYKVTNSSRISGNEWQVKLAVKLTRYKTPGISPNSRRKIAVIPFRTTATSYFFEGKSIPAQELSRQLAQNLITEITQSRRFSVLDREYIEEYLQEKQLIISPDAPLSEQMKLGEVLGVDYLLLGTLTEASQNVTPYTIQVTGESGYSLSAELNADYRIVVMATRQIKWSDTLNLTLNNNQLENLAPSLNPSQIQAALLKEAAKQITHKTMENIYPLKIVQKLPTGEVILNQGGITVSAGETLDVFSSGDKIIDPYTKESLGSAETWIATLKITRISAKMAYAEVEKGDINIIKIGNICRRKNENSDYTINNETGRVTGIEINNSGGVVLPFD